MKSVIGLIVSIIICFSAAFFGSRFMPGEWYENLIKPSWNPPNYIFGPVWTILYFMMAVSVWMIWNSHGFKTAKAELIIFLIQLGLNGFWSYIFFGLQNPGLAFLEIIFLWIFIVLSVILFMRLNRYAGFLLLPYLLWVTFASYLNYTIWRLNI